MTLKLSSLFPLLLTALVTPAMAETLVVQGGLSGITTIRSDNAGFNYGSDAQFIIGRTTAPANIRGLLSFDFTGIPAGATITSITLTLTSSGIGAPTSPNQGGSVALELYDLTGNFVEGSGPATGVSTTTAATWTNRGTGTSWATPGGDYTTLLSSVNVDPATNSAGTVSLFSNTPAFLSAAQTAFNNAEPLTLLLKLNAANEAENLRRAFFFVSDDAAGAGAVNAPKLTIEYIPEPGSAALLAGSTVALLGMRRRRAVL